LAIQDPLPFTGIYGITKSALDKYAYSLRMELQLLDIQVISIRPGAVDTNLLNVSLSKLEEFKKNTSLYKESATKFDEIVKNVESKKIPSSKLAKKIEKILTKKKPKFVYYINRSFLLRLLNILPDRFQTWIIKKILTKK
jgi:short-subunit dehydrogenase